MCDMRSMAQVGEDVMHNDNNNLANEEVDHEQKTEVNATHAKHMHEWK